MSTRLQRSRRPLDARCRRWKSASRTSPLQPTWSCCKRLAKMRLRRCPANVVKKSFSKFSLKKRVVRKQILNKVSGVFKPGTITLVLGQPGSGKSSLMKILSGRFPIEKNVVVDGEITFNGKSQKEIKNRLPQFVSYVNQRDKHFPVLTVKETLDFAHVFCGRDLPKHAGARGHQKSVKRRSI